MLRIASLAIASLAFAVSAATPAAADNRSKSAKTPDPNEKICEEIIPVGSRIGAKRVCATRAEWEAKKRRDRDWVDEGQRRVCVRGAELCPG